MDNSSSLLKCYTIYFTKIFESLIFTFTIIIIISTFPLIANPIPKGFSNIEIIPSIHSIKWPKLDVFSNFIVSIIIYWISSDEKVYKKNKKTIDDKNIDNKILYFSWIKNENNTTPKHATIAPLEKERKSEIKMRKRNIKWTFLKLVWK